MNKFLIVVDMQNDFIDGALGTPEAQAIVPKVAAKIEEYKKLGYEIVFTRDTHHHDYLTTNEGIHLPVEHCIRDSFGWQIHKDLDITGARTFINKRAFGYIDWEFGLDLDTDIDDTDLEIELVGLCTDICVISNAMILKATFPETKIIVDGTCCAGVTPESHDNALNAMEMCQIEIRR